MKGCVVDNTILPFPEATGVFVGAGDVLWGAVSLGWPEFPATL